MFAENSVSAALHRKNGFREVGIRLRLGQFNEVWHDVRLMERRSTAVGGPGLPLKTCPDTAED
jgi:phosphinothricin acetyltransferase